MQEKTTLPFCFFINNEWLFFIHVLFYRPVIFNVRGEIFTLGRTNVYWLTLNMTPREQDGS